MSALGIRMMFKGKRTPMPPRLMRDMRFLYKVRVLLDSCSDDPEKVRRAQENALEIVGSVSKDRTGGLELVCPDPAFIKLHDKCASVKTRLVKTSGTMKNYAGCQKLKLA